MADVQVKCINKVPRNNPHEGITHLAHSIRRSFACDSKGGDEAVGLA